jgi:ABC-type nitrate/sulfonate/bicarbonate transport system permease component
MTATFAAPAPAPATAKTSSLTIFARAVWALLWPIAVAVVIVVLCWIIFLAAFDVAPVVGKSPKAVWSYLFTDPEASANRKLVFGFLGTTLHDASLGFVGGMVAALVVSALFVMFRSLEQAFMPIAMLLRSVPLVAMTPIILLIFKRGSAGVAVIGGIVVFFPALVNISFGLRSASKQTTDLVLAYGGSRWTVIRKVAIPTALPAIFASARISVPGALIGALVAEWLATGKGIGGAILNAIGAFDYGQVWANIVVLTGVSLLLYTVVGVIETAVLTAYGPNAGRQ